MADQPVRYFEDFPPGYELELGQVALSATAIVEFAQAFDPQPMHVDVAAAEAGVYGGLIASGWHTASSFMRLLVDAVLFDTAGLGSPGVERLRWLQPVRPDEPLHGRLTVLDARVSQSRPDRGIIRAHGELRTTAGEVVFDLEPTLLVRRRPTESR